MIKQIVAQYIEKEKLITLHDKVLVTLSGGADSVALLRILLSLGYNCEAAHCNFQLRGEESNRDEVFVRQLCRKLNIPLHVTCFDTKVYAQDKKISIEMAARKLRYRWFNALTEKHNYTAVAVAHHKDDSVETILLNLIRGTGINGLLGIRPKNGNIVRPLLCITHEDITRYLLYIQQDYVTDSTNLEDEFTRNKIRLKLLPLMQELNPSVKEKLVQTTNHLNEVAAIYHHGIEEGKARVQTEKGIHILRLLSELSPHALLFEILYPLGFNTSQIEDIMQSATGQSGKQFISNQHWRVVKDRELFLINRLEVNESSTPPFKLHFEEKQYTPCFNIIKDKHIAYFDADKLTGEFNIRKWKQGDIFIPFGMKGIKRISDFLTDRKYSIVQKEDLWVLCTGEKIAWVIGERTDNRFRIDESTRRVIIVRLQKQETDLNIINYANQ